MLTEADVERGDRILAAMRDARVSRTQVATHLGLTENAIWRYETGRTSPPATRLGRLADLLGVSWAWLAYGVDERQGEPESSDRIADLESRVRLLEAAVASLLAERADIRVEHRS
ncbi:MAG: helix-turn-helix transcriptional regulator [Myxococcota bacterium]